MSIWRDTKKKIRTGTKFQKLSDDFVAKQFWNNVTIKSNDECWIWKGKVDNKGYGMFVFEGKYLFAHRVSYYLTHGADDILSGKIIHHMCKIPLCVNPNHLKALNCKEHGKYIRGSRWYKK